MTLAWPLARLSSRAGFEIGGGAGQGSGPNKLLLFSQLDHQNACLHFLILFSYEHSIHGKHQVHSKVSPFTLLHLWNLSQPLNFSQLVHRFTRKVGLFCSNSCFHFATSFSNPKLQLKMQQGKQQERSLGHPHENNPTK